MTIKEVRHFLLSVEKKEGLGEMLNAMEQAVEHLEGN